MRIVGAQLVAHLGGSPDGGWPAWSGVGDRPVDTVRWVIEAAVVTYLSSDIDERRFGGAMPGESHDAGSSTAVGGVDGLSAALTRGIANELRDSDPRLVEDLLQGQVTAYLVIEERVDWLSVASARFGEPGRLHGRARHAAHAVHIIEADPARISSIYDLARLANVSARTLQLAFRECVGVSPMEYLRRVRLERVHRDLLAAGPTHVAVAEIALRHGFSHFGRFAAAYRQVYGCNPSSTLRSSPDDPRRPVQGRAASGDNGGRRVVIPVRYRRGDQPGP